MNKLNNFLVLNKSIKLVLSILIFGSFSQIKAQERVPFDQGKKYILADVAIVGKISFNAHFHSHFIVLLGDIWGWEHLWLGCHFLSRKLEKFNFFFV